jgi:tripartite ATP-independent transporter DctP family solute receptor
VHDREEKNVRINRRTFIGTSAAAAASVALAGPSQAADFTLKVGTNTPATDPLAVYLKQAIDAIHKETNGKVEIRLFPNNQLGSNTDLLSQLRSGALEFYPLSPLILQTLVPEAAISGIGYAWSGYDKVWPAMDGDLGAFVRKKIAGANIHAFETMWDNGFRQITSSTKPILTPEDLDGFKIRVPPSPLWTSMFKAFGADPTSINFAEVYTALQTHLVDGQENPLALIYNAKLYEVQKYLSMTNHMWDGYWLLAGRRWQSFPDEVKSVITKHFNASGLEQRKAIAKANGTLQATFTEKKMLEVHEVDKAKFRAALASAGFYKQWQKKFGPEAWKLLEKYSGSLG